MIGDPETEIDDVPPKNPPEPEPEDDDDAPDDDEDDQAGGREEDVTNQTLRPEDKPGYRPVFDPELGIE